MLAKTLGSRSEKKFTALAPSLHTKHLLRLFLAQALLEKSLFVTNGPGLDELDDEGEEGDGAGGSGSSSSTDGDNDWEQEDGGAAGKQAAAGGSVSELKVCLWRAVLRKLA